MYKNSEYLVCVCACVRARVRFDILQNTVTRLEFNITLSNKSITEPYRKIKSEKVANWWISLKSEIT